MDGCDYESSAEVLTALRDALGEVTLDNAYGGTQAVAAGEEAAAADVPMYSVDTLVRRAAALQLTPEARRTQGIVG